MATIQIQRQIEIQIQIQMWIQIWLKVTFEKVFFRSAIINTSSSLSAATHTNLCHLTDTSPRPLEPPLCPFPVCPHSSVLRSKGKSCLQESRRRWQFHCRPAPPMENCEKQFNFREQKKKKLRRQRHNCKWVAKDACGCRWLGDPNPATCLNIK